ncbi:MAG: hypothetical protein ACRD3D_00980 [Terriglobia bacterium]
MKVYGLQFEGMTPLLQSRAYTHEVDKLTKETSNDYEERTWRNKAHVNAEGFVTIPAIFMRNSLREAARYLGEQIPGKGKSTYTKHFNSGLGIYDDVALPVKQTDLKGLMLLCNADGVHGSGKRVTRIFPKLEKWGGTFKVYVLDETITKDVLHRHAVEAGNFRGMGTRRPANGGEFGRFKVLELKEMKA